MATLKIFKPVMAFFRFLGFRITIFIDDILLVASSYSVSGMLGTTVHNKLDLGRFGFYHQCGKISVDTSHRDPLFGVYH